MAPKKPYLTADVQARTFILASHFLVANENVMLSMADTDYGFYGELLYYPEYGIDMGSPSGGYSITANGTYKKRFESGLVLVNPDDSESKKYELDGSYDVAIPVGGGLISTGGTCDGSLSYDAADCELELPAVSGIILMNG